ncbi:hypothetical protein UlMin_044018 [Ulmus minor]
MEANVAQTLQFSAWIPSEKAVWRPSGSALVSRKLKENRKLQALVSARYPTVKASNRHRNDAFEVSCSYKNFPGFVLESERYQAPLDENLLLNKNSERVKPYLNGRCIYLVGMMGSGKTTVGKILSQVLGYSFSDSDTLVEHEAGGISVAEIFNHHGEGFFRAKETEVLQKLSLMNHFVVSTGGGAVIRDINWAYMQTGVSVWLDVPLKALARRIAAVGTGSRPLLKHETGDVYNKTLMRLSSLFEQRGESYAKANARVSLEGMLPLWPFLMNVAYILQFFSCTL